MMLKTVFYSNLYCLACLGRSTVSLRATGKELDYKVFIIPSLGKSQNACRVSANQMRKSDVLNASKGQFFQNKEQNVAIMGKNQSFKIVKTYMVLFSHFFRLSNSFLITKSNTSLELHIHL